MRKRIQALIAVLGIVFVVGLVAAPAYAADTSPQPEKPFTTEAAKQCFDKLAKGGDVAVDDCQKAPSPLLPGKNEIIWGSLSFLVLLVAMWKFGVPAVKNMEQAREDRIRNDLEGAEKAKADAEAEKAQYLAQIAGAKDEAGRLIEEARQAAESVRADLIARAEQEANDIRARAPGRHRQPDEPGDGATADRRGVVVDRPRGSDRRAQPRHRHQPPARRQLHRPGVGE